MKPIYYIPLGGTWAYDAKLDQAWGWFRDCPYEPPGWHQVGSDVTEMMGDHGFIRAGDSLPLWSGAIGGWRHHQPWKAGARNIYDWIQKGHFDASQLNFICYSHAGQVIAYLCAMRPRLPIRSVVTICSPMRRDMDDVWAHSELTPDNHLHLYARGWGDRWRWFGQGFRFKRKMDTATNYCIKGGHSGMCEHYHDHKGEWQAIRKFIILANEVRP